jgi:glycosyltransferase involved in cell wall biosynthesis
MRVLFYVEPLTEKDAPFWKRGWILQVRRLVDALRRDCADDEVLVVTGDALEGYARHVLADCRVERIAHWELIPRIGSSAESLALNWYRGTAPPSVKRAMAALVKQRCAGFVADACVTLSPAPFLRAAFPSASLHHFETGLFSRGPVCETAYLDPRGMLQEGCLGQLADAIFARRASQDELADLQWLRDTYRTRLFAPWPFRESLRQRLAGYRRSLLLPLQFSGFYGYDAHARFKDQYDLLLHCLTGVSADTAVVVTEHPDHPLLDQEVVGHLSGQFPNLVYLSEARAIPGASQYAVGEVSAVATVSSAVGMQAAFWRKPLIVLGSSHLDLVADSHELKDFDQLVEADRSERLERNEHVLAWLLRHYYLPMDLLTSTGFLRQRLALAPTRPRRLDVDVPALPRDAVLAAHRRADGARQVASRGNWTDDTIVIRLVAVVRRSGEPHEEVVKAAAPIGAESREVVVDTPWRAHELDSLAVQLSDRPVRLIVDEFALGARTGEAAWRPWSSLDAPLAGSGWSVVPDITSVIVDIADADCRQVEARSSDLALLDGAICLRLRVAAAAGPRCLAAWQRVAADAVTLGADVAAISGELSMARQQVAALEGRLAAGLVRTNEAESALASAQRELAQVRRQTTQFSAQLAAAHLQVAEVEVERETALARALASESALESVRGELVQAEQQVSQTRAEAERKRSELESQLQAAGAELQSMAAALDAVHDELAQSQQQVSQTRAEAERKRSELESQLQAAGAELQSMAAALDAVRTADAESRELAAKLQCSVLELGAALDSAQALHKSLLDEMAARDVAARAQSAAQEAQLEELDAAIRTEIAMRVATEDEAGALRQVVDATVRDRDQALSRAVAADADAERLTLALSQMQRSRAWRLLRPLRAAGDLARDVVQILLLADRSMLKRLKRIAQLRRDRRLLESSGMFSAPYYFRTNPDVAGRGLDPVRHFLVHGGREGRAPGPWFDAASYLHDHPDVRASGLNPLIHYLRYGMTEGRLVRPAVSDTGSAKPPAFFTICSKNYSAYAITLFRSLRHAHPESPFHLVLADTFDDTFQVDELPFPVTQATDLGIPDLQGMVERYDITELNTAVKPFAFEHLFRTYGYQNLVYLDPDILVIGPLTEVVVALHEGSDAVVTPHACQPAEGSEISDIQFLRFGIYNLGFIALRNSPESRAFVAWWSRRLERDCRIDLAGGVFTDQKWVDLLPAHLDRVRILRHPGYNVAYWNLAHRTVRRTGDRWLVNGERLVFVHFSGNNVLDPDVFSKHVATITAASIGDLRELLERYRREVLASGHERYRKLRYSLSDAAGTTAVSTEAVKLVDDAPALSPVATSQVVPLREPARTWMQRGSRLARAVSAARAQLGGWRPLLRRSIRVASQEGLIGLRRRAARYSPLPGTTQAPMTAVPVPAVEACDDSPRLLYMDWDYPDPNRDAASITAIQLMQLLKRLGYAVTFFPAGLSRDAAGVERLRAIGVAADTHFDARSVSEYIESHGHRFTLLFLSRGPVCQPYLAHWRAWAPQARIVFNTVDLHFLRELRQAQLASSPELLAEAERTRAMELELAAASDLTIVLSRAEVYVLKRQVPEVELLNLSLIFESTAARVAAFDERRDVMFVGSFPHRPNVDAMLYFTREIWPLVRARLPGSALLVVGSSPPPEILALGELEGVRVLGFVADLERLFASVRLTVAPLLFGAGVKGKIGSSLCQGVPCVATSIAVEGMGLVGERDVLIADAPEDFAAQVVRLYTDRELWGRLSEAGLRFVSDNYSMETAESILRPALQRSRDGLANPEQFFELSSHLEYARHREELSDELRRRRDHERALLPAGDDAFQVDAHCAVCRAPRRFLTSFMYAHERDDNGRLLPNWREHLACDGCGLVTRTRAALHLLGNVVELSSTADVYLTEQITPFHDIVKRRFVRTVGSEYLPQVPRGTSDARGLRSEDVMKLTFATASFDAVLSFDVLEHVPDYRSALREFFRVLKPGGTLLFSAPFSADSPHTIVRAVLGADGEIKHLMQPEYHGNPVDPDGGALCYQYFGWDLLHEMAAVGFSRPRVLAYWSSHFAYLGGEQYMFIAHKPRREVAQ